MSKNKNMFSKRVVVFSMLILILSASVYINWQQTANNGNLSLTSALKIQQTTTSNESYLGQAQFVNSNSEDDYFTKTRESRKTEREKAITEMKEILNNVKSTDEAKLIATEKIAYFTTLSEKESAIESLVIAKGFEDCVAVLSDKSISCVVKTDKNGLAANQTVQIQDIILSNCEISCENIKIIEIK